MFKLFKNYVSFGTAVYSFMDKISGTQYEKNFWGNFKYKAGLFSFLCLPFIVLCWTIITLTDASSLQWLLSLFRTSLPATSFLFYTDCLFVVFYTLSYVMYFFRKEENIYVEKAVL